MMEYQQMIAGHFDGEVADKWMQIFCFGELMFERDEMGALKLADDDRLEREAKAIAERYSALDRELWQELNR